MNKPEVAAGRSQDMSPGGTPNSRTQPPSPAPVHTPELEFRVYEMLVQFHFESPSVTKRYFAVANGKLPSRANSGEAK